MASPSTSRDIDVESQIVSRVGGVPGEESVTSERGGSAGQTPIRVEHNEVQSGAETHVQHVVDHNPGMQGHNRSSNEKMAGI
jgi:hypothetical protein